MRDDDFLKLGLHELRYKQAVHPSRHSKSKDVRKHFFSFGPEQGEVAQESLRELQPISHAMELDAD